MGGTEEGVVSGSTNGRDTTYVVVAGEDGVVRFYDLKFRLEVKLWFSRKRTNSSPQAEK